MDDFVHDCTNAFCAAPVVLVPDLVLMDEFVFDFQQAVVDHGIQDLEGVGGEGDWSVIVDFGMFALLLVETDNDVVLLDGGDDC
jgi:hypothetical protein